eukprot:scaffold2797_cov234-Pinguiococcus_pyrenoidosus.AAC.3
MVLVWPQGREPHLPIQSRLVGCNPRWHPPNLAGLVPKWKLDPAGGELLGAISRRALVSGKTLENHLGAGHHRRRQSSPPARDVGIIRWPHAGHATKQAIPIADVEWLTPIEEAVERFRRPFVLPILGKRDERRRRHREDREHGQRRNEHAEREMQRAGSYPPSLEKALQRLGSIGTGA